MKCTAKNWAAPRSWRLGSSLVEVVVATALLTIALGAVSVSLVSLYRADDRFQRAPIAAAEAPALFEVLRHDIHRATDAVVEGNRLRLGSETNDAISYEFGTDSAERFSSEEETAEDSLQRFRLPVDSQCQVKRETLAGRTLLSVVCVSADGDTYARLIAELGRNKRLSSVLADSVRGGEQ